MRYLVVMICASMFVMGGAQEVIELPFQEVEGVTWEGGEKSYFSKDWATEVVTNVSKPSMEVFRPAKPNGISLVVAPGGGLYAHSIDSEGNQVAEWLVERGVTVFVLKYRLVPTGADGVKEYGGDSASGALDEKVAKLLPYSVQDALEAVRYVREHAADYEVAGDKIGLMGFSAGGAVVMGAMYSCDAESRPDYLVPVYAWTRVFDVQSAPADAPPMLVVCASDDPLDLAPGSVEIYNSWLEAGRPVGMHMYAAGGHGFGMRTKGLPSDTWIDRFHEWLMSWVTAK